LDDEEASRTGADRLSGRPGVGETGRGGRELSGRGVEVRGVNVEEEA
jgi:hypothetical protein